MKRSVRFNVIFVIIAIVGMVTVQSLVAMTRQIATIPYSQFQELLQQGKVADVGVSDRFIEGKLKEPLPGGQTQFVTTRVDLEFAGQLQKYGVRYTGEVESTLLR